MKIAIICDTHYGVRGDNVAFLDYQKKFFDEIFFPTLEREKITSVVHLGDLVDRPKQIGYVTLNRLKTDFLNPLHRVAEALFIPGNHDAPFKHSIQLNAIDEIVNGRYKGSDYKNFNVFSSPTEVMMGSLGVLLLPWICPENRDATLEAIRTSKSTVCMGHLELQGFSMYRGIENTHGDDPSMLMRFDKVFSGHFHTPSKNGNIQYLGAPFEFTWSDHDDPRGFSIFDTETLEVTFVRNPFSMFTVVTYSDEDKTLAEVIDFDFSSISSRMVKIVVKSKTNQVTYNHFMDKVEKASPMSVKVIDDHLNLSIANDVEVVNEAQDTLTICQSIVNGMEMPEGERLTLASLMTSIYQEAMSVQ